MVDFGLLGFFCRFQSLSPSIKPGFLDQISVAMAIQWVLTTVSFSPFSESVVSAIRVIRIVLTVSMVFGKNILCPRAVFIILSIGWCSFVSVLGSSLSKIEWRYIYRIFIFLLVMEWIWYRPVFRIALGLVIDMITLEVEVCMLHLDLLAEAHGVWYYILSMEVKEETSTFQFDRLTVNGFMRRKVLANLSWELIDMRGSGIWDDMVIFYAVILKRITQSQYLIETVVRKCWCHYVYISGLALNTSALMLRFVKRCHSHKLLYPIRNKEKSNMKLDNNRSSDRLASKATLRKASSNSLLLYFLLVYGTYICVCNNCVSLILYVFVTTLLD